MRSGAAVVIGLLLLPSLAADCDTSPLHDPPTTVFEVEAIAVDGNFGQDGVDGAAGTLGSHAVVVRSYCAAGGACVELGTVAEPLQLELPAGRSGWLWLRSAQALAPIDVTVGSPAEPHREPFGCATLPVTHHAERFEWQRVVAIPDHAAPLRIELEARSPAARWRLDQVALLPSSTAPPSRASPAVIGSADGTLELRAAYNATIFDSEWVLKLLREQRDAVAALLGVGVEPPLLLIVVSEREPVWHDTGAFQNGCALFLRADELHLPWRSYAHEIVHVIEEQRRWHLPWWLSEGIACVIGREVARAIYGSIGSADEQDAVLDRLLADGDTFHRAGSVEPNPVFDLLAAPADEPARDSAYNWAAAVVRAAARAGGRGFWPRLCLAIEQTAVDAHRRPDAPSTACASHCLETAAEASLALTFAAAGLHPADR